MFDIYEVIGSAPPLTVVDVGAASMGQGTDAYHAMMEMPHVRVVGFEPNAEACAKRNAEARPNQRFMPCFIGRGGRHNFYCCDNPLTSSLYEPNHELLAKFQNLHLPVQEVQEVDTVRLDDIEDLGDCDFLKLDVQGAELDVIDGARNLMPNVMVVHTEVEFIPMYKDQPLFGDVDVRLRQEGFLLHKFMGFFGRQMKPIIVNNDPYSALSQLVFAEAAVYVRNFMEFDRLPSHKLLSLAGILHSVYGSFDLAALALAAADKQTGGCLQERYVARLTQPR